LFKIVHPVEGPVYFRDKAAALFLRDKLRDAGHAVDLKRGPDHKKGESF